jgi:hypothetical protein
MSFSSLSLNNDSSIAENDLYSSSSVEKTSLKSPRLSRNSMDSYAGIETTINQLGTEVLQPDELETLSSDHAYSFSLQKSFYLKEKKDEKLSEETINFIDDSTEYSQSELMQLLKEMDAQAKSVASEIKSFSIQVKLIIRQYKEWKNTFGDYGTAIGYFLAGFEYFNVNHKNFLDAFKHFPPEEYYKIEAQLRYVDSTFKYSNCGIPLIFNIIKLYFRQQIRKDLDELQEKFEKLKAQSKNSDSQSTSSYAAYEKELQQIESCMDQLRHKLAKDQAETFQSGQKKFEKFIGRIAALPLEILGGVEHNSAIKICKHVANIFGQIREIFEVQEACRIQDKWIFYLQPRISVNIDCPTPPAPTAQDKLHEEVNQFIKSLESCTTIKEIENKLNKVGIEIEIPYSFEEWKRKIKSNRFQRYLVQNYYYCIGKRPLLDKADVQSILKRRLQERKEKIDQSATFIQHHIRKCQHLEFDQIVAYFKVLHLNIDQVNCNQQPDLKCPPTSKDEWKQCIQDPAFCSALAAQWVDYHEMTGQMGLQALRQMLLSKNQVEHNFLRFRLFEYVISIVSSVLQLLVCLPKAKIWAATNALELFAVDLGKLGIPAIGLLYVFHPLYPDNNFKIENIFIRLAEHFFAIKYKPNEYSLEGYKIIFQIRWIGMIAIAHYLILLFQQTLLWLNIRLIENCIMRLDKKPFEEDMRYIQLNEAFEQERLNCKQRLQELSNGLKMLKIEDAKLNIHPSYRQEEKDKDKFDPIQNFVDAFKDPNIDFSLFPEEVHQFFEENLGFKLTEPNKAHLQKALEEFLSAPENQFTNAYQDNILKYLRA